MSDNGYKVPGYPGGDGDRWQTWPRPMDDQSAYEKLLLVAPGGALTVPTTARFSVRTPDTKLVTKVTVFIVIPQSSDLKYLVNDFTEAYAGGARLWLTSLTRTRQGNVQSPPTRDIVPTRTGAGGSGAGLLIPTSPALWGYEVISQVPGDEMYGELTVNALEGVVANAPAAGLNWAARVDYQSTTAMTAAEWAKAIRGAGISANRKTLA